MFKSPRKNINISHDLKFIYFSIQKNASTSMLNIINNISNDIEIVDNIDLTNFKEYYKFTLFRNLFFSPLHINTLCEIIIQNLNKFNPEIYNLGSSDKISKKDFIQKLCKILHIKRKFNISNYSSKIIQRPLDMSMNSNKINKFLKLKKYNVINEIYKLSREYK